MGSGRRPGFLSRLHKTVVVLHGSSSSRDSTPGLRSPTSGRWGLARSQEGRQFTCFTGRCRKGRDRGSSRETLELRSVPRRQGTRADLKCDVRVKGDRHFARGTLEGPDTTLPLPQTLDDRSAVRHRERDTPLCVCDADRGRCDWTRGRRSERLSFSTPRRSGGSRTAPTPGRGEAEAEGGRQSQ